MSVGTSVVVEEIGMADVALLQQQIADHTASLFHEGLLGEQYNHLRKLQDYNQPDFVENVVTLYFEDSRKIFDDLANILEQQPINYSLMDRHVHQLKGSSSSVGAQRVHAGCLTFRYFSEAQDFEACHKCIEEMRSECAVLKEKMEGLLQLERQLSAAVAALPNY